MSQPSYHHVHQRLRRERGRAAEHPCVACGAPAVHWAYDKTDRDELVEAKYGQRVVYSAKLERYQPMCQPCHRAIDHPPKTHCKYGHALSGSNIYVRPNGGRLCRTCKRESLQQWRTDHPNWREGISA